MGAGRPFDADEAVRLYRELNPIADVAAVLNASKYAVNKAINERVPKAERNEIRRQIRVRVNERYHRADPAVANDGPVPATWAGAFRELACWCRKNGYEQAWERAREMAAAKGVRL